MTTIFESIEKARIDFNDLSEVIIDQRKKVTYYSIEEAEQVVESIERILMDLRALRSAEEEARRERIKAAQLMSDVDGPDLLVVNGTEYSIGFSCEAHIWASDPNDPDGSSICVRCDVKADADNA